MAAAAARDRIAGVVDARLRRAKVKGDRRGEMPETVSLKEAIRKAIEEDDKRENETPPVENHEEAIERTEMSFVEEAGQLIPQEDDDG